MLNIKKNINRIPSNSGYFLHVKICIEFNATTKPVSPGSPDYDFTLIWMWSRSKPRRCAANIGLVPLAQASKSCLPSRHCLLDFLFTGSLNPEWSLVLINDSIIDFLRELHKLCNNSRLNRIARVDSDNKRTEGGIRNRTFCCIVAWRSRRRFCKSQPNVGRGFTEWERLCSPLVAFLPYLRRTQMTLKARMQRATEINTTLAYCAVAFFSAKSNCRGRQWGPPTPGSIRFSIDPSEVLSSAFLPLPFQKERSTLSSRRGRQITRYTLGGVRVSRMDGKGHF